MTLKKITSGFLFLVFSVLFFYLGSYIVDYTTNNYKLTTNSSLEDIDVVFDNSQLKKYINDINSTNSFIYFDDLGNPNTIDITVLNIQLVNENQKRGIEIVSEEDETVINSYSTFDSEDNVLTLKVYVNTDYYTGQKIETSQNRLNGTIMTYIYDLSNYPLDSNFKLFQAERSNIFEKYSSENAFLQLDY